MIGDVYQLNFFQEVRGNFVQSHLHYVEKVAPTDPGAVGFSIADAFFNDCADLLQAELSEDWIGVSMQVQKRIFGFSNPYTLAAQGAYALMGAISGDAIPSNSPLVLTKYTTEATKNGRGRWYQSGIPESSQDGGTMVGARLAAIEAAMNGACTTVVETAGGAGRWQAVVFSTVNAPVFGINDILYFVGRGNIANMRPRRAAPGTI